MNIEELLQALPSKEEIAKAVGLQARGSSGMDILPALGIFGTGMLLGAGLALLFAPKPGSDLRREVADTMTGLGTQLSDLGDKARDQAHAQVHNLAEQARETVAGVRTPNGSEA